MFDQGRGLGGMRIAAILGLLALTVGVNLGGASRLTYHEAFVAQPAREMIAAGTWGGWLVPKVGGQPWVEKPPLLIWLVAGLSLATGSVTEWTTRVPSALATVGLALGVAGLANRRFGPTVGWLAGLIQATTAWTILRGRLGEADLLLAALITGLMAVFDRLRTPARIRPISPAPAICRGPDRRPTLVPTPLAEAEGREDQDHAFAPVPTQPDLKSAARPERLLINQTVNPGAIASSSWLWAFWGLLGLMGLAKGTGFGAALVLPAIAAVLIWDRDWTAIRRFVSGRGLALVAVLTLAWPLAVAIRHPAAVSLWTLHVTDRLASRPEHFIGGPRWQYLPALLLQVLPWTPLALLGVGPSLVRASRERNAGDRLLWAWAVVPVLVLSLATVKNAHYAIHALPPWSIWAALGLVRVERIARRRPWWSPGRVRRLGVSLFGGLGLAVAVGYALAAPRLDTKGQEWVFCAAMGQTLDSSTPLICLYEDWDRKPYPTPFGPVPHDWAIRLYYFDRRATWRQGVADLVDRPPVAMGRSYALLGRDRDQEALGRLGRVEQIATGPAVRFDRAFQLFRVDPQSQHLAASE